VKDDLRLAALKARRGLEKATDHLDLTDPTDAAVFVLVDNLLDSLDTLLDLVTL